jgi:prepilin-type N-terminal cleavage/methylation domain-containing protein
MSSAWSSHAVRGGVRGRRRAQAGFGLVEVLAAAAVLGVAAAAGVALATALLDAAAHASRRDTAADLVASTLQRLRALPPLPSEANSTCVLQQTFPHADPGANLPGAYVVLTDGAQAPAGSFVHESWSLGRRLRVVARFVRSTAGGWSVVSPADVLSFSLFEAGPLPGTALLVEVSVSEGDAAAARVAATAVLSLASDAAALAAGGR